MKTRVAIIGGGITGLAAAAWLEQDHDLADFVVVEASDRPGGKIHTEVDGGYTLEWGPQGFLDNAPDTLELAELMQLPLVQANHAAAERFILRDGRLRRVEANPLRFMLSSVLPLAPRLRLLAEPFARPRPSHDETVFDFAARRIGRAAAEVLVDAMVTGVFAGDSRALSLAATFPRMAAMESEHGSLTRALVAKKRAARRTGSGGGGPAGPGGTLSTFDGGMVRLPTALASRCGPRVVFGHEVDRIERDGAGFRLAAGSLSIEAEAVLLAVSSRRAAELVGPLAPAAVAPLSRIETAPIAVVMLAYADPEAFAERPRGFGFLVPRGEASILGTLYCHDIFPAQAPLGALLLRVMVGGARAPEMAALDDGDLVREVRRALAGVLGGDPEPDRHWIVRWSRGITQYTVGHLDRVAAAEEAARAAGLELAGSSYRGVSVNDCIRQARAVAAGIARQLS